VEKPPGHLSNSTQPRYILGSEGGIMQREEIIARYRHLREITNRHLGVAVDFVAASAMAERVKHLGIVQHKPSIGSEEAMSLVFDLAVHTAKPGRSLAIDRYARSVAALAGSDEDRALQALRDARFSIWRIDRLHDVAGLVATDVLRGGAIWLLDEGLESSVRPDFTFASRLSIPAEFAITCGVVVPIDGLLLDQVLHAGMAWMRNADPASLADDPRFAASVYRAAIAGHVMERVQYRSRVAATA
jgi:hypothetical protein